MHVRLDCPDRRDAQLPRVKLIDHGNEISVIHFVCHEAVAFPAVLHALPITGPGDEYRVVWRLQLAVIARRNVRYPACRAVVKTAGLNWGSLKVCRVCARKFPLRLRRLNLEATKCQAAASPPTDIAMELLRRAATEGWTVVRIRYEADRIQHGTQPSPDIAASLDEVTDQGTKFRAINADPPWAIWPTKTRRGGSDRHYPRMSLDEICALRVPEIIHPKAFLFLWMPGTMLPWVGGSWKRGGSITSARSSG